MAIDSEIKFLIWLFSLSLLLCFGLKWIVLINIQTCGSVSIFFIFYFLFLIVKVKTINKENRFVFNILRLLSDHHIEPEYNVRFNRTQNEQKRSILSTLCIVLLGVPLVVTGLHNNSSIHQTVQFIINVFTSIWANEHWLLLLYFALCWRPSKAEERRTFRASIYLIRMKTKRSFIKILRCIIRLYSHSEWF